MFGRLYKRCVSWSNTKMPGPCGARRHALVEGRGGQEGHLQDSWACQDTHPYCDLHIAGETCAVDNLPQESQTALATALFGMSLSVAQRRMRRDQEG